MPVTRSDSAPPLSIAYVQEIFRNLESGDGKKFFDHVAEDVDWIVEGTHPLAGHYRSKPDFLTHTFEKLAKVLPRGTQLWVEHALVSGDWAVVELQSHATAKNGLQVRQPVLLGVSICKWHDRRGSSVSQLCPCGPTFRRESNLGCCLRLHLVPYSWIASGRA